MLKHIALSLLPFQHIPNLVTSIHTMGQRVVVTDVQESLFWVRYRRNENQLIVFADDTHPRWVTTACLLDYDTMASADKFGNISIVSSNLLFVLLPFHRFGTLIDWFTFGSHLARKKPLIINGGEK